MSTHIATLRNYLSILRAMFSASIIADMSFRANLTVKVFTDFLWYFAHLSTFEVIYNQTSHIGGWSIYELRVFLFILFINDALYMILFSENIEQLPKKVVNGEIDLLLAKPIDSQFMLSFMKVNSAYCANLVLLIGGFFWSLASLDGGIPWLKLPILAIMIVSGVGIVYCIKLLFATTSLRFGNTSQIMLLFYQFYRLGTRPDIVFPKWLRYVLLTIIPMGFLASAPAHFLLDPWNFWWPAGSVTVFVCFFILSRWIWVNSLRDYASASS